MVDRYKRSVKFEYTLKGEVIPRTDNGTSKYEREDTFLIINAYKLPAIEAFVTRAANKKPNQEEAASFFSLFAPMPSGMWTSS